MISNESPAIHETSRLHGQVLSLKTGVPVVAIDPVAGGGKIHRQGSVRGWPFVFGSDLDHEELRRAFDACLEPTTRQHAAGIRPAALERLADVRPRLFGTLRASESG